MLHQVQTWRAMQKKDHVYNHACNYITVDYQQIVYGNTANQIHGFTTDYGKFILISISKFLAHDNDFPAF